MCKSRQIRKPDNISFFFFIRQFEQKVNGSGKREKKERLV
jgi:hypothetical protein